MRRVVIALWTWHLLAPSIALLSVALFSDRLPPAYRLGAACDGCSEARGGPSFGLVQDVQQGKLM